MMRRLVTLVALVAILFSGLVPSSLARQIPWAVSPASANIVDLPPALAKAGIAPGAWGRMVDQIHAQQVITGCAPCQTSTTGFAELKKLAAADGARDDEFGNAVAIHGDTVVIGALYDHVGSNSNQGSAYVFVRNQGGPDNWGLVKQLTASDGAADNAFGHAVAVWGDTIVIGAILNTVGGNVYQGAAYVFGRNQGGVDNWGQVTKLTASDGAANDFFGFSLDIWGDTIVVGAHYHDVGGNADQGSAYVYRRNQGGADAWGQVAELTASDGAADDVFGFAVALHDDTVVVGAYYHSDGTVNHRGSAYVFERNQGGADAWGQAAELVATDGQTQDGFGESVAIWDDTIVVGAPYDDTGSNAEQGSAYVFERNQGGADTWGQVAKLTASDGAANDLMGYSVGIWSDTVVVGALYHTVGGNTRQGSVYVFRRNEGGAESWGQSAQLTSSDGAAEDNVGSAVAIWGDTLIAGALGAQVNSNRMQGAAYLFSAPCTPDSELKKETASDGAANDKFGWSVDLWGETLVVGAAAAHVGSIEDQGAVYVFSRNQGGVDAWGQVKKLTASDGARADSFGTSVAVWGDTLVVGAYGASSGRGAAYVFERNQGGAENWGQVRKLQASDGAPNDYFGISVDVCGDLLVVGASYATVGANSFQGAAYVFGRNQGGAENWGQVKKLTGSDSAAVDQFGYAVAIWGETVVVGASWADISGRTNQGAAYLFARNLGGADNWGQVKKLVASDGGQWNYFGYSVGIWGDTVVVGAPDGRGAAYLYRRNQGGADNWGQAKKLTASDSATNDEFGQSVAIWDGTVVVGNHKADVSGHLDQGAAYLYARNLGGADNWGQVQKLTASDGAAGDWFGSDVAIWGDSVVAGARLKDVGSNLDQGAAYLFGCAGVTAPADVAISKSAEPTLVRPGDVLTYTLGYSNLSLCATGAVTLCDTTPPGLTFASVAALPAGWTEGLGWGNSLGVSGQCWYTPSLSCGEAGSIVLTATVDMSHAIADDWVLINTATITTTGDITPTNNLSEAEVVVQGLEIRKSHFPATVTAAWDFWFHIDVTNTASSPATNVVVTDTLPAGIAAYSVQPDMGGVFDGVNTVVWSIPSIGPNTAVRLTIKARTFSTQAGNCLTNLSVADSEQAAPPVSASDTICVVKGEIARPTATPTPAPTPTPVGTTVVLKKGGPGNSLDTYIYRNQPYSNYWLEPLLKVGYKQTNATLIQFDLSPIPAGAKVEEAWLEVFATGWSGPGADMVIGAYAISNTVQISQTTWVSPELGLTWAMPGANDIVIDRRPLPESTVTTTGPLLWYRFDVSKLTQQWLDGAAANNGVLLRCENCLGRAVLVAPPEDAANVEDLPTNGILKPFLPGNLCPFSFFFASGEYSNPALGPRLVVRYQ